jgi:serine phosphatase RsbU (regulator of sigma subunit)
MSLMGKLGNLEAAGLVQVARIEPDLEYLFRHALVQEAAYASLLESDRQQLHLSVGEAIERVYPERLNEFAAVLARHFEKAGDDEHALVYFIRAAEAALESYANKEAEMHFRRALELSCPACEHAYLLGGLGESLYRQTRFEEAIDAWQNGISLYQDERDWNGVAHLYSRLARVTWHMGDLPGSLEICKEGLSIVNKAPDSGEMAMLLHETARSNYFNGNSEEAFHLCKKSMKMAENFGATKVLADALATYGVLPDLSPDESLAALEKSVKLGHKNGYLEIAARAYHNLGAMTSMHTTDMQMARHYYQKAAELGRQRGVITEELYSMEVVTRIDLSMGKLIEVEEALERIEKLVQELPDPSTVEMSISDLKIGLWWMRGKWKEAVKFAYQGYKNAFADENLQKQFSFAANYTWMMLELHRYAEVDDLSDVESVLKSIIQVAENWMGEKLWPYTQLIILNGRQKRFDQAHKMLQKAEEIAKKSASHWNETSIGEAKADLLFQEGHYDDAMQIYVKVVEIHKKIENRWSQARCLMDWAETCASKADPADLEQARNMYREALILFDEIGAHRHKKVVEDRLLKLQEKIYNQAVSSQRDAQELARAAEVQGSLLPDEIPQLEGWQIAVTLHPARQTSGDFYDFIPLVGGRLGILVADVADKGAAAALFMATSQSLIRTYAGEFIDNPDKVLAAASRRILIDTHAGLFVTVFYGVLDTNTGELVYCNAGHTPAIWVSKEGKLKTLPRSGPPLGAFEGSSWELGKLQLHPGENLVLYSDGVTEAQNDQEEFFGDKGLEIALKKTQVGTASTLRDAVLQDVHQFVGGAPQFDDITLMVIHRE